MTDRDTHERPFKAEIAGSNPAGGTILSDTISPPGSAGNVRRGA